MTFTMTELLEMRANIRKQMRDYPTTEEFGRLIDILNTLDKRIIKELSEG